MRGESSVGLLGLFGQSGAGLSWSSWFEEVKSGNQTAAGCLEVRSGQVFNAAWKWFSLGYTKVELCSLLFSLLARKGKRETYRQ